MPAPVAVRDPTAYYDEYSDPSYVVGGDPVVPLRNFLAMQKADRAAPQPLSGAGGDNSTRRRRNQHMNDITMSTRLFGYVFSCISMAVSTISSAVFYARSTTSTKSDTLEKYAASIGMTLDADTLQRTNERIEDMNQKYHLYFGSGGNLVMEYKMYGSIAISGLLTVITLSIVIAHFDSVCCVKKNRISFGAGSILERNLILILIILSVGALFLSTSKFSVGEAQANVFFSTWTNFVSCVVNYEVWRKGSGKEHTFANILFGHKKNWFLLAIFASIAFLSTIDFFMSNNVVNDSKGFDCMDLSWSNQWLWFALTSAVACWGVVLLHRYCKRLKHLVAAVEVIVSLAIIGVCGYVVHAFTGGRLDQVPCPSNLYFSCWFSFFMAIWIFSTMVVEGRGYVESDGDEE